MITNKRNYRETIFYNHQKQQTIFTNETPRNESRTQKSQFAMCCGEASHDEHEFVEATWHVTHSSSHVVLESFVDSPRIS